VHVGVDVHLKGRIIGDIGGDVVEEEQVVRG
jgi:hypothetical protein